MTTPKPDLSKLRINRSRSPTPSPGRALRVPLILAGLAVVFVAIVVVVMRGRSGIEVEVGRVEVVGGAAGSAGITANGYVVARTRASVSSRISGRLAMLSVEEGSQVRRGQILARLENADYVAAVAQATADSLRAEAALLEAQASRDQLQRDLVRAQDLFDRNLESARAVEDLQAQLAGADARIGVQTAQIHAAIASIALAKANLDNTFIRAPFDGTVLRKDAEVGEVVAPVATGGGLTRGAVVTMANLKTLEVEVDVNEAYIAQIRSDQQTRIILDAYPALRFEGTVRQIVPTADRQRATVQVKVAILERDDRILPEMGARVEFLTPANVATDAPSRILVPAKAVRADANATIVWVVRDGVVSRAVIDAGPVSGDQREVRSGLSGGERVILEPPASLKEGDKVSVITH